MKSLLKSTMVEKFGILMLTIFFNVVAFAQDTTTPKVEVNTTTSKTTTTEEWFTNPIYWVIGAVLLIILVAVVARGNRRAD